MIHTTFFGISESSFEEADAVILSVPYDAMTSWQAGARNGPRAILEASEQVELYDEELKKEIPSCVKIFTQEQILPDKSTPEAMVRKVEEHVRRILNTGKFPVMIGGDHSLSIGATLAVASHVSKLDPDKIKNTGILHLDAHTDLRESWEGSTFSHASSMRHALEKGLRLVQAGIRSTDRTTEEELPKELRARRVVFFSPHAWGEGYGAKNQQKVGFSVDKIVDALPEHVYISIDLDVFDPSIMPAVGTPEPGGLTWEEVLALLCRVSRNRKVLGFDVMELSPIPGIYFPQFTAARLIAKLLGYTFCHV